MTDDDEVWLRYPTYDYPDICHAYADKRPIAGLYVLMATATMFSRTYTRQGHMAIPYVSLQVSTENGAASWPGDPKDPRPPVSQLVFP